jgi:hypothetical protein
MKTLSKGHFGFKFFLALLIILVIVVHQQVRASQLEGTFVNLPQPPTPEGYTIANGDERPPVQPLNILNTFDLANGLPDNEKFVYIVRRSKGVYEKYLISVHFQGDIKDQIGLEAEDVLVTGYPLKRPPSTPYIVPTSTK